MQTARIHQQGVTLIELMIVIAIIAIIAAIAVPAYQGYVEEAKFSTATTNLQSLRVFLEDYHLDNGDYRKDTTKNPQIFTWVGSTQTGTIKDEFSWSPDGDKGNYDYYLATTQNSYDLFVTDQEVWVYCEDRLKSCCDSSVKTTTVAVMKTKFVDNTAAPACSGL